MIKCRLIDRVVEPGLCRRGAGADALAVHVLLAFFTRDDGKHLYATYAVNAQISWTNVCNESSGRSS